MAAAPELDRLTLSEAEALLQANNRELRLAQAATLGAQADVASAGAHPNPQLSLNVAALQPGKPGASAPWDKKADFTYRVDQLVERGDKRLLRTRAAEARLAAARSDQGDVSRQQRLQMRQAYYDLLRTQERTRILAETADLYRKNVEAAALRVKAGDLAASDLARLKVEALRAENEARQALADQEKAQAALAYMIGLESEAKRLRAVDSWPSLAETPGPESDIEQRADVKAALARVQAAEQARALALSLRKRDVSVGVQYEHCRAPSCSPPTDTVGVGLSVPLFVFYDYEGEVRRAEADLDAARDALDQVRGQARAERLRAASDLNAAQEQVRRFEGGLLREAERGVQATEFAYQRGAVGLVDLLDARRTLRAVQLDAVDAQAGYAKALAAYQASHAPEEQQ
jgi:cobalt-zinc-cadmium efflux system outer membrane protein